MALVCTDWQSGDLQNSWGPEPVCSHPQRTRSLAQSAHPPQRGKFYPSVHPSSHQPESQKARKPESQKARRPESQKARKPESQDSVLSDRRPPANSLSSSVAQSYSLPLLATGKSGGLRYQARYPCKTHHIYTHSVDLTGGHLKRPLTDVEGSTERPRG